MGRHYNHVKSKPGGWSRDNGNSCRFDGHKDQLLGKEYGVNHKTIRNAGKFAAAVETLRTIDPDIEAKVVTGKGPTEGRNGRGVGRRWAARTVRREPSGGPPGESPLD